MFCHWPTAGEIMGGSAHYDGQRCNALHMATVRYTTVGCPWATSSSFAVRTRSLKKSRKLRGHDFWSVNVMHRALHVKPR